MCALAQPNKLQLPEALSSEANKRWMEKCHDWLNAKPTRRARNSAVALKFHICPEEWKVCARYPRGFSTQRQAVLGFRGILKASPVTASFLTALLTAKYIRIAKVCVNLPSTR